MRDDTEGGMGRRRSDQGDGRKGGKVREGRDGRMKGNEGNKPGKEREVVEGREKIAQRRRGGKGDEER